MIGVNSVCLSPAAIVNLIGMTTGAFSHRQQAVQEFIHIVDIFIYGRYYGIWHGGNVLTTNKVEGLASWWGVEDGTGWELAVSLPVFESLSYS